MKPIMITAAVTLFLAGGTVLAGEAPWYDMANCSMCKPMSSKPGLMESMKWEQYPFSHGIVLVTRVDSKQLAAYRAAHAEMTKTGERLMQGEQLPMCGSCTALGKCLMMGAKEDYIETPDGDIWILTSDNPEAVTELHAWVKRNEEEMHKITGKS